MNASWLQLDYKCTSLQTMEGLPESCTEMVASALVELAVVLVHD